MFKQKQYFGAWSKKRLSSVFLIVIMLFLPQFAFANIFASSTIPDAFLCPSSGASAFLLFANRDGTDYVYYSANLGARLQFNSDGSYDSNALVDATCRVSMTSNISGGRAFFAFATSSVDGSSSGGGTTVTNSTTTISASNPSQDVFNGIMLFFLSMVFIVWYFRGKAI